MATPSQYIQDDTGTYIPATQRPDGSWRKARRVKDGYIPQDEQPLYESKGKIWAKSKPTLPLGLDPCYATPTSTVKNAGKTIPGLNNLIDSAEPSKSSKKKKKKSEKNKLATQMAKLDISSKPSDDAKTTVTTNQPATNSAPATTDPAKRIRNLKKKLRDINALKLKIESGELKNPGKDQLEKIARQSEIEAEVEDLELELVDV